MPLPENIIRYKQIFTESAMLGIVSSPRYMHNSVHYMMMNNETFACAHTGHSKRMVEYHKKAKHNFQTLTVRSNRQIS